MKTLKKALALLLAVMMTLALGVGSAFAEDDDSVSTGTTTTGTITITNPSRTADYTLYKLFDASTTVDEDGKPVYTVAANSDVKDAIEKDNDAPFTIASEAVNGAYPVAIKGNLSESAITTWISQNLSSLTAENFEPTWSNDGQTLVYNNVPYGYYYLKSSLGAVLSLSSVTNSVQVTDKNSSDIEVEDAKSIIKINEVDVTDENANKNAKVGDVITFQISFTALNYITEVDKDTGVSTTKRVIKYTVEDEPVNMTIDISSLNVVVTKAGVQPNPDEDITSSITSDTTNKIETTGFEVVIPWANGDATNGYGSIYPEGSTITVTYKATITAAAIDNEAKNVAKISHTLDDGTTTTEKPTPDPIEVPTYSVDIVKTAPKNTDTTSSTDTYNVLSGAEFELYDAKEEGNKINLVYVAATADTAAYYRPATADDDTKDIVTEFTAGEVTIKGLAANTTYYLEETTAPDGYNKLTSRVPVAIEEADLTNTAAANGVYTRATDSTDTGIQVINNTGSELPSTGGIGTTIFYIAGGVLVVAAGVLLVAKKRMNSEK